MMKRRVLVLVAGAVTLLGVGLPAVPSAAGTATGAARAAASWGRAIVVPGLAALNKGRNSSVGSVSCPSRGSCAAGGYYTGGGRHQQGFVVSKRNGRWAKAIEVPGLGALNKGKNAQVVSMSCAAPGNCVAGGYYGNGNSNPFNVTSGQGFVVSERNGRWAKAVKVPGLGALNKGGNAEVSSVSCASAGYCAAAGSYLDGSGLHQGFVVSERNGRWGQAIEVPGLGALNKGGLRGAGVSSVSCASPGNCTGGGTYYADTFGRHQAFVVSQKNGSWGTVQTVAGNLNVGESAGIDTVSCGSAGNCSAGGQYRDAKDNTQAFVISEVRGTWSSAREVAGRLNTNGTAAVASVSCPSAGNCAAGGDYETMGGTQGFVVREKNGVWSNAITVPGLRALNKGAAEVLSVSCAPAGSCVAVGSFQLTGRFAQQGFVTK